MAENHAKDVRTPPLAVRRYDRRAGAKIDLHLVGGYALQAAKGQRLVVAQSPDEATHTVVLGGEAVIADQVLVDALRCQAGGELGLDERPKRFTEAGLFRSCRRRLRADGRLAYFGLVGAEGRLAYVAGSCVEGRLAYVALGSVCGRGLGLYGWYRLRRLRVEVDMPGDGVAVQSQLLGNASDRPMTLMKSQDGVDGGHAEQVRHVCPPAAGSAEGYMPNGPPQSGLF